MTRFWPSALEMTRLTPGNLLQLALHGRGIQAAVAARDFDQHRFAGARALLQIAHRVGGHNLAFVDDDDLLAGLADFGKDVRAQNNRVIAREALDQVARFVDLLGIEARGRLVQNQHVRIVDDRLGEAHALAVTFRKLPDDLVSNVRDGAALAGVIHPAPQLRSRTAP